MALSFSVADIEIFAGGSSCPLAIAVFSSLSPFFFSSSISVACSVDIETSMGGCRYPFASGVCSFFFVSPFKFVFTFELAFVAVCAVALSFRPILVFDAGFTANSCAPGVGGGKNDDDGEGNGDAEASPSSAIESRDAKKDSKKVVRIVKIIVGNPKTETKTPVQRRRGMINVGQPRSRPCGLVDVSC